MPLLVYEIICDIFAILITRSFIHFTLTTTVHSSRLSAPTNFVIIVYGVLLVGCWLSPATVCLDYISITQSDVCLAIETFQYFWYITCKWLWRMVSKWTDHRWFVIISPHFVGVSKSPPLKCWGVNGMMRKQSHRCDWILLLFSVAGYCGLHRSFIFVCNQLHQTRRSMLNFDCLTKILQFAIEIFS